MNEETRKYFDAKFEGLATVDELNDVRSQLEGDLELMEDRIITRIDRSQDELAQIIARSFDPHEEKLQKLDRLVADLYKRVKKLEEQKA